jgi:hypothetical protein
VVSHVAISSVAATNVSLRGLYGAMVVVVMEGGWEVLLALVQTDGNLS